MSVVFFLLKTSPFRGAFTLQNITERSGSVVLVCFKTSQSGLFFQVGGVLAFSKHHRAVGFFRSVVFWLFKTSPSGRFFTGFQVCGVLAFQICFFKTSPSGRFFTGFQLGGVLTFQNITERSGYVLTRAVGDILNCEKYR